MKELHTTVIREHTVTVNDLDLRLFTSNGEREPRPEREPPQIIHTHFYNELFIGMDDMVELFLGDNVIRIGRGDVAIIPAGYSHIGRRAQGGKYRAFGFFGRRVASGEERLLYRELRDLLTCTSPRVYRAVGEISDLLATVADSARGESSLIPSLRLVEGLLRLARLPYETVGDRSIRPRTPDRDVTRIAMIEEMLNCRFASPCDPDELAADLYITRRHLDRIVRAHYGRSLRSLITERRLRLAERLLVETDLPLTAIAERSGFGTPTAMKKSFLAELGITPREYREKHAEK